MSIAKEAVQPQTNRLKHIKQNMEKEMWKANRTKQR